MNKIVGIGLIIILTLLFGFMFLSNRKIALESFSLENNTNTQVSTVPITNIKASFAIFTNDTFRVFTASMYHNLSEDVYIESNNPNIVHIKKTGTTWDDFFKTLPFSLTKNCLTTGTKEVFCTNQSKTLNFYINGVQDNNLLDREIKDGDKALISFGSENEKTIQEQIEKLNVLSR